MKKLIIFTLALTLLLILSNQAIASKDYNISSCEKPRYGIGVSWYCEKEGKHGHEYIQSWFEPEGNYPRYKIVYEDLSPGDHKLTVSCYEDLFWEGRKSFLKKSGLTPKKGGTDTVEWFHKWLQNSHINSYWHHKITVSDIPEESWVIETDISWYTTYHCPYTYYYDYYSYGGRDHASLWTQFYSP